MSQFWEKVEHYNAKLILYSLIVLLGIILLELFVTIEDPQFLLALKITDWVIVTIFAIDLIFLAQKARSVTDFLKHYWLDLLAIFPFAFFFDVIGRFYQAATIGERISLGQAIFHESVETEKGIEAAAKVSKLSSASRFVRIIARGLKVIVKSCSFTSKKKKYKRKN